MQSNDGKDPERTEPISETNLWKVNSAKLLYFTVHVSVFYNLVALTFYFHAFFSTFLLNLPFTMVYNIVMVMTGLVMYAYFASQDCDPVSAGYVSTANQVRPIIINVMCKGIATQCLKINGMNEIHE